MAIPVAAPVSIPVAAPTPGPVAVPRPPPSCIVLLGAVPEVYLPRPALAHEALELGLADLERRKQVLAQLVGLGRREEIAPVLLEGQEHGQQLRIERRVRQLSLLGEVGDRGVTVGVIL